MKILNESISFVTNGISYDIPMMRKVITSNSEYLGLDIHEIEPKINVDTDNEISRNRVIEKIKNQLPIAIFASDAINISINNNENQLFLSSIVNNQDPTFLCEMFESLLKANIDKFSNLSSIMLTYTKNVNAENEKLKLLNEDVEKIKDWNKNKTFILTIPFEYEDFIVSFKIQKLIPKIENIKDRSYQFSAIFSLRFSEKEDKQEKFRKILQKYSEHFYSNIFNEKYNEFMGLKYEKTN